MVTTGTRGEPEPFAYYCRPDGKCGQEVRKNVSDQFPR